MRAIRLGVSMVLAVALVGGAVSLLGTMSAAQAAEETTRGSGPLVDAAIIELLEKSLEEKKGLMIYAEGQAIPGVVTRLIGTEAVEMRNQDFSRVIVRLDEVVAVAAY